MAGNTFNIVKGNGGLPKIVVTHESGDTLEVYLKGASVTSWKNANGCEYLYLSPESFFDKENPIRGGIPIAFPQFGLGDLPRHGFARLETWRILHQDTLRDGAAALVLELRDTEWTRGMWNYEFALEYTVILRKSLLVTQCTVKNTGASVFDFAFLYHTYFGLSDINNAKVSGLQGCKAMDKIDNVDFIVGNEPMEFHTANKETGLHVCDTHNEIVLKDSKNGRSYAISRSSNLTETVVWNPSVDTCAQNEDLADDSYKKFICIEPGAFFKKTVLTPGESAVFSHTISVKE